MQRICVILDLSAHAHAYRVVSVLLLNVGREFTVVTVNIHNLDVGRKLE